MNKFTVNIHETVATIHGDIPVFAVSGKTQEMDYAFVAMANNPGAGAARFRNRAEAAAVADAANEGRLGNEYVISGCNEADFD